MYHDERDAEEAAYHARVTAVVDRIFRWHELRVPADMADYAEALALCERLVLQTAARADAAGPAYITLYGLPKQTSQYVYIYAQNIL